MELVKIDNLWIIVKTARLSKQINQNKPIGLKTKCKKRTQDLRNGEYQNIKKGEEAQILVSNKSETCTENSSRYV